AHPCSLPSFPTRRSSDLVGAQPKGYDAALAKGYAQPWRTEGFNVWGPWFDALDRFKAGLAPIIGADAKDICPQANVSSGIAKVLDRKSTRLNSSHVKISY